MSSTTFSLNSLSRKQWPARISLVVGLVCLTLFGWIVNTTITYAGETPGGNMSDPVVRTVDIARPAVVRIMTTMGGRLTVRFAPLPQSATFPLNGRSYPLTLSGSGAFVSASGDILTADHVVNPPHDQSLNEFLYGAAANDVANYINQRFSVNPPYTKDEVLFELESGAFPTSPAYTSATSEVYLSTEYTGPQSVSKLADVPATTHAKVDRIEQESSFDRNDVAIVHVSTMTDMPSIQLGDSSGVQEQDNLTIIGFPGSGDVNDAPTDLLTSSVNKVFVSAMKTTKKGAPVIQVGGNVEQGDSGGPALDEQGNVVGIVSFGLDIPNIFGQTTFLQAGNSAKTLVQSLHLETTPGRFQKAWNQAFTDYASNAPGHWHTALKDLQQIATQYPLFQAVTSYLTFAQAQAKSEHLSQPPSQSQPDVSHRILMVGISVVMLMALIVSGVAFAMRRGKKSPPIASKQPTVITTPPDAMVQNDQMRAEDGGASPGYTPPLFTSPQDTYVVTGTQPFTTNRPGEVATKPGPSPAWLLPGPVRPSSDQEPQVSACGHLNTSDAGYCRTCGKPIAPGHTFGPLQP